MHIDRNEQALTGMLKYGLSLILIRLRNSDNTILKRVKLHQSNSSRFRKWKHFVFLTFARIKFYERAEKPI